MRNTSYCLLLLWPLILTGCPEPTPPDLAPRPGPNDTHLLRLAHISDPQIVDEESPARSVRTDNIIAVSWRPQEAYSVQTLDATLQRINTIHENGSYPVDFVLVTGDLIELAQANELQWFIDTMDGHTVTPDSGVLDGATREDDDARNPKLPYDAAGLHPDIPWYTCYGNHDALAVGNFPIDQSAERPEDWTAPLIPLVAESLGFHRLDPAQDFMLPTASQSPAIIRGEGPPYQENLPQIDLESLEAGPIEPDPERRFLSKREFVARHLASTSIPQGHGFTRRSLTRGETWYSVRPVPKVPVRLIVFDTVAAGPHYGLPLYYGALLRSHLEEFIIPELNAAEAAGEWVILSSHHPSEDFAIPFPPNTVRTEEFRSVVSGYPNVIAHLAGHTHRNRARIVPGPYPYLEIETSAIIDFPQEGRILDIFIEGDGQSIRVESTLFSHAEDPTGFSAESFRRARIDYGLRAKELSDKNRALDTHASPINPQGAPEDRDFTWTKKR